MKIRSVKGVHLGLAALALVFSLLFELPTAASPFGQGEFGSDTPFGSSTSLSISLGDNVALNLDPDESNFSGSGSHVLTVTSNDAVGYKLYAYSPSGTDMTNGSNTIPTSLNTSAAPLGVNSWGFNTDGSSNYRGMQTTPLLIKDADGPYTDGDDTTVSYAATTDITAGAGAYTVGVVYTAVAENE